MSELTNLLRPQPLGIYPLPAGYLLLPIPRSDARRAQAALLRGDTDIAWPDVWSFYRLALEGDSAGALHALSGDSSPLAAYNRFALSPDASEYPVLRSAHPSLAPLFDVVAYAHGYIEVPPTAGDLEDELQAFVLAAQASHYIERGNPHQAVAVLMEAVEAACRPSPLLAAQLLGQLAGRRRAMPGEPAAQAIQEYQQALVLAGDSPLGALRAELWLNLGMAHHERAEGQREALQQAVRCYQRALNELSLEEQPEGYALAHNNLALAYLAMPMYEAGDHLRMAIAVQSLREALRVYRKHTHPEQWASAQLNLANALQYLPSSHPQENLIQAVQMYEALLEVRSKTDDPVGYARLLSNQANALAHLGLFAPAVEKLGEAYKLFIAYEEHALARSVAEQLARIQERAGSVAGATQ